MISKTRVSSRIKRKSDDYIVDTVRHANKNKEWSGIAQIISGSTRKYSSVNLKTIDREAKEGDTILVPGKVLGSGEVSKRITICALSFSESAREKLKAHKSEMLTILEEIKKNPKAQGIKVIR